MVSHDSSMDPSSSILHQFNSDAITSRPHFEDRQYTAFQSGGTNGNLFSSSSLGVLPSIQLLGERMSRSMDLVQAPTYVEASDDSRRLLMDHLGAASDTDHQGQRLALSLGSHFLVPSAQYRQRSSHSSIIDSSYLVPGEEERENCSPAVEQHMRNDCFVVGRMISSPSFSQNRSYSVSCAVESFALGIGNSRYLKPTRSLLKEVVNINDEAIDSGLENFSARLSFKEQEGFLGISSKLKAELCSGSNVSSDKHEIQIRITKLVDLLEQVESRYEQYWHQMEEVVSSFEVIAGLGAAKSYTVLALQAMSRHFCSLGDAIVSQISAARRQLYTDLPRIHNRLSELGLFDREARRTSRQQIGMIQGQRQPWRPVRGLPENSVAILRSWLFEHFLHPYPNDSEKLTLASETGLTKNQVSNWFINARVRLWKPMIEEMYKEEFGESSIDSNPSSESSSARKSA